MYENNHFESCVWKNDILCQKRPFAQYQNDTIVFLSLISGPKWPHFFCFCLIWPLYFLRLIRLHRLRPQAKQPKETLEQPFPKSSQSRKEFSLKPELSGIPKGTPFGRSFEEGESLRGKLRDSQQFALFIEKKGGPPLSFRFYNVWRTETKVSQGFKWNVPWPPVFLLFMAFRIILKYYDIKWIKQIF